MLLSKGKVVLVGALAAFFAGAAAPVPSAAEGPQVTRKLLLKQDMTVSGREAVMIAVQLEPGAEEGRHSHPADLFVLVEEGELVLENEGMPTATYRAGDPFYVASGKIHNGINKGLVTTKLTAILVAEKGKPLSAPAK